MTGESGLSNLLSSAVKGGNSMLPKMGGKRRKSRKGGKKSKMRRTRRSRKNKSK